MRTRGFTLLEVIAAIFILTVGVGGSFSLIHQTLVATSAVKLELTGSYLAQEGMEIVKNLRDQGWLTKRATSTLSWDEHLRGDGYWQIDYLTQESSDWTAYNSTPLNIDSNGFYGYSAGDATAFTRKVSLEEISTTTTKVTVNVEWKERGRTHSVEILENITNWYEK